VHGRLLIGRRSPSLGGIQGGNMDDPETKQLLTEIRDAQRDLVTEYRRVANEALQTQRRSLEMQSGAIEQQSIAVKNQLENARIYRYALGVIAVIVVGLLYWMYRLAR
jgi:hypothetical protein